LSNSGENSIPASQTNQATASKAPVSNGPRQVIKPAKSQMKKMIFIADQQHYKITYNHIIERKNQRQIPSHNTPVFRLKLMGDGFSDDRQFNAFLSPYL
jgi:hypothetical protein